MTVGLDAVVPHIPPAATGRTAASSPLVADIPPPASGFVCPNCLTEPDADLFCSGCGRLVLPPKSTAPAGIHSRGTGRGERSSV